MKGSVEHTSVGPLNSGSTFCVPREGQLPSEMVVREEGEWHLCVFQRKLRWSGPTEVTND